MTYEANEPMNFENALNIRELGGYINSEGISLKKHRLLRGGDLSNLTAEEMKKLENYGIKTCIDLRISDEKENVDPFNNSNHLVYHAIPIAGPVNLKAAQGELLYELYMGILEQHDKAIVREMQIIANEKEGIIFHCTAGKDRTGLTAMFILAICGVCSEQIIADYAASGRNNRKATIRQKEKLIESGLVHIPDEIFESRPETMEKILNYLEDHYGGPVEYLRKTGVSDREIQAIRSKMLEV